MLWRLAIGHLPEGGWAADELSCRHCCHVWQSRDVVRAWSSAVGNAAEQITRLRATLREAWLMLSAVVMGVRDSVLHKTLIALDLCLNNIHSQ